MPRTLRPCRRCHATMVATMNTKPRWCHTCLTAAWQLRQAGTPWQQVADFLGASRPATAFNAIDRMRTRLVHSG